MTVLNLKVDLAAGTQRCSRLLRPLNPIAIFVSREWAIRIKTIGTSMHVGAARSLFIIASLLTARFGFTIGFNNN